jgi:hypothetical protein
MLVQSCRDKAVLDLHTDGRQQTQKCQLDLTSVHSCMCRCWVSVLTTAWQWLGVLVHLRSVDGGAREAVGSFCCNNARAFWMWAQMQWREGPP